jgi:Flp pilus assembly protein TadG
MKMKEHRFSILRKILGDQRGQTAVITAVIFATITALAGASVETGHVYYAYRQLVASTDAAALAGAQAMPDILEATTNVTEYSSKANQKNASNLLLNASVAPNFYCSSTVTNTLGINCQPPPSGEGSCTGVSTCNALQVVQTAKVNLWFGGLIGIRTFNLTAQATAAMRGGNNVPYNIAVIIDTTASMKNPAPSGDGCGSGATQISCAVSGLSAMLREMDPCPSGQTCTAGGAYVDGVALFVFPPVNINDVSKDTTCPTTSPGIVPYAFVNVTPGSTQDLSLPSSTTLYPSNAGTYEVVPFNNTYKANDASTTPLTASNPLSIAAGSGGGSCKGLQAPGGYGTYYAQVINAAQAALVAQQASLQNQNSVNIMIILSDGDATACATNANTSAGACNSSNDIVAMNCSAPGAKGCSSTNTPLNGTGTSKTNATGYELATYPSALGECGQAVQAAQAATKAGTTVYTVAMGSPTSGGCLTDAKYTITSGATYGTIGYPSGGSYSGQPCNAIQAMASNAQYAWKSNPTFYSDATSGCIAPGTSTYTTMGAIFQAIETGLTSSRLIPNGS